MNAYETYLKMILELCLFCAGMGFIINGLIDLHHKRKGLGKFFSVILGIIIVISSVTIALFIYRGQIFTGLATAGFVFY